LATILAYLTAIVRAFKAVFGFGDSSAKKATDSVTSLGASVGGVSDSLGSATAKAKELKKTIAGFDELEILNAPDDSSGSGGGGVISGGGGYEVGSYFDPEDWEMPDVSAFQAKVEEVLTNVKQNFEDLKEALKGNTEAIQGMWDWKKILGLGLLGGVLAGLGNFLVKGIKGAIEGSDGLKKFLQTVFSKNFWSTNFGESKFNAVITAMENKLDGLKAVFAKFPSWVAPVTAAIALLVAGFVTMWNKSEDFRNKVTNAAKTLFDYLKKVITDLWNQHLKPLWDSLKILVQAIIQLIQSVWNVVKELWNSVLAPIFGYIAAGVATLIGGIIAAVTGLLAKIVGFAADLVSITVGMVAWLITTVSGLIQGLTTPIQNFWNWLSGIGENIKTMLKGIGEILTGVFTLNWKTAWQGVKDIVNGAWGVIKGVVNGVISAIEAMVNGAVRALNRIHWNISLPSWLPVVGGKSWSFGLNLQTIYIPRLANGGVLQEATTAQLAEYAGAHNNPEIVTPENLMRQIVMEGNDDLADTFIQVGRQIIAAIQDNNVEIKIGDDVISASAARGAKDYKKRTGLNQFAI